MPPAPVRYVKPYRSRCASTPVKAVMVPGGQQPVHLLHRVPEMVHPLARRPEGWG
ncbi:hypothetical protein [Streptomyces griseorubiginosus]|uniref:hypothetical protein n=1 Tax=Streptomyces griseorubiginosus TaxID=67304 RepID=UPI00131DEC89|nr:hypothetical protein [Streptomyces griseorubiginosus]